MSAVAIPRVTLRCPSEAAEALGVSPDYFDEHIRPELKLVRRGRLVLVSLSELERHGSLAYEQIAALLGKPPDAVRNLLMVLRERGLIDAVMIARRDEAERPATYWRLTEQGHEQLARIRRG